MLSCAERRAPLDLAIARGAGRLGHIGPPRAQQALFARDHFFGSSAVGAPLSDVLSVARAIDINANGVHREPIKNGRRERRVAEIAAPFAQRNVGGDCGGCVT